MTAAIAVAALSLTAPFLTKPEAREAVRVKERALVRKGYIDRFSVGRCTRNAPRRVRCYVQESLGRPGNGLFMDGWTGVWLRDGKTLIRYPKARRG